MKNTNKTCSQCGQKDRCSQLYEKLGQSKGPGVAWKVTAAFLIPIVVFIGSLAGLNRLLQGIFEGNTLTVISFSAAVILTLSAVLLMRVFGRGGNSQ
jgi:hypothetical protein